VLCAGCVLFAAGLAFDYDTSARTTRVEAVPAPAPSPAEPQGPDFSRFAHTNPQHARLPCLLCHQRADNSARPRRSGHTPCAGCHTQQFADQSSPICTICHTSPPSPALKDFPPLRTFNVRFDHATHTGARANCATCHRPERRGGALSIPAGTSAHATCFQCHTPRAQGRSGQDISSCGACHRIGRFARTPETAAAYRVNFSHAPHTAKGLACADCHTVRAGAPQRRQVASPAPLMHHASPGARSCMTCHDDKRAFGGDDFKDCTRCHRGSAWHF
jgi:c(7)-type cytochrome triheme protein